MIYICVGNNAQKRKEFISKITNNRDYISLTPKSFSKEILLSYAQEVSLFGGFPIINIENVLLENEPMLLDEDLAILKKSETIFVFIEDKLLVSEENKYKKYAEKIERFEEKIIKTKPKNTPFAIADAFARKDKIGAWVLYIKAIDSGMEPEGIAGMLFWKIKNMILFGSKIFKKEQLKIFSSEIISLYHKAHNGEIDFYIGLEQFILKALS